MRDQPVSKLLCATNHFFIRALLVCIGLWLPLAAQGASFDCAKAKTKTDKTICSNPELSKLDGELGDAYTRTMNLSSAQRQHKIRAKQIDWLEGVRDKCTDKACLVNAYKARLNILDPLFDDNLTCSEMAHRTKYVFTSQNINLGSGNLSPLGLDYHCSQSIASQPYMTKLLALAETIRGGYIPQSCTGSVANAEWRAYQFDLTEAGFAPKLFLENAPSTQQQLFLLHVPSMYEQKAYFRQWSEESPYYYKLYNQFNADSAHAIPALVNHYETALHLPPEIARSTAQKVLDLIISRAAGSFMGCSLDAPSELVTLARDPNSTPANLVRFFQKQKAHHTMVSPNAIYRALKVALLKKRSPRFITALLNELTPNQLRSQFKGGAPLLSFAIHDHTLLKLLLRHHVPVNAQNVFGKTALFYAIQFNDEKAVHILIAHGADVNHAYKTAKELRPNGNQCVYPELYHTGRTPLMHAAQNSNVAMLKILVKHGANLNATDELKYNALDYAYMGKNKANEAYLKSLGMVRDHPVFPFKAHGKILNITSTLSIAGNVTHLKVPPALPSILIASVGPWSTVKPSTKDGIYFLSLKNPGRPKILSHFPSVNADDLAVSPSGKTVYALQLGYNFSRGGVYVINARDPRRPLLKEFIKGNFLAMHLARDGKHLYIQERANNLTLVYALSLHRSKVLCRNPFREKSYNAPVFAYSFEDLPGRRLAIDSQDNHIYVFRINNPCKGGQLYRTPRDYFGSYMAGLNDGTLVADDSSLLRYRFNKEPRLIGTYSPPIDIQLEKLSATRANNVIAALFSKQVTKKTTAGTTSFARHKIGLLSMLPDGHFMLKSAYKLPDRIQDIGSLLLDKSDHIYLGVNGGLVTADISGVH